MDHLALACMGAGLVVAACLYAPKAHAEECTGRVHIGTLHSAPGYRDFNPGLGAECGNVAAGLYANSVGSTSGYVGYVFRSGRYSVTVGAVSGYVDGLTPLVLPSVDVGPVTLSLVPSPRIVSKRHGDVWGLHLSVPIR